VLLLVLNTHLLLEQAVIQPQIIRLIQLPVQIQYLAQLLLLVGASEPVEMAQEIMVALVALVEVGIVMVGPVELVTLQTQVHLKETTGEQGKELVLWVLAVVAVLVE
jgi:hypothetical protein